MDSKILFLSLIFFFKAFPVTQGGPYQVKSVALQPGKSDTPDYLYDTAGNRLRYRQEQFLTIGLRNKPTVVKQGMKQEVFKYGLHGQRYLRLHADGSKTFYLDGGNMEHKIINGQTVSKIYIHTGSYSPALQVELGENSSVNYNYYIVDSLGSTMGRVNDAGQVQGNARYDAWGETVAGDGTRSAMDENHKGFTGHEDLANARLVHMNGRVYDPYIGQFLAPDPFIQNSGSRAALNRYAYIQQSPLSGIDPSGYVIQFLDTHHHRNRYRMTVMSAGDDFYTEWYNFELVDRGQSTWVMRAKQSLQDGAKLIPFNAHLEPIVGNRAIGSPLPSVGTGLGHKIGIAKLNWQEPEVAQQAIVDLFEASENKIAREAINQLAIMVPGTELNRIPENEFTMSAELLRDRPERALVGSALARKGYSINDEKVVFNRNSDTEGFWTWEFGLRRVNGYRQDTGISTAIGLPPTAQVHAAPGGISPSASFVPIRPDTPRRTKRARIEPHSFRP